MEQKCPLCEVIATYHFGIVKQKEAKLLTCPHCKKLSFEDGTEDILAAVSKQLKDELIAQAIKTTEDQRLHFSINTMVQTSKGKPFVDANVI